jgi:two-component system sensor kinase FixL
MIPPSPESLGNLAGDESQHALLQAEWALRVQVERYQRVLAALGEGLVVVSHTGVLTEFNPRAEELMRKSNHEFKSIFPVPADWSLRDVNGCELSGEQLPAGITLRTGKPCRNVLLNMTRPDGSKVWLSVNTEPLVHEGETAPYAVVVSFHDITEIKQAHDILRTREEHLARLLDAIPDMLFVVNTRGDIIDYRAPKPDQLFLSPEQFLGKPFTESLPPHISEPLQRTIDEAISTNQITSFSYSGDPYLPYRFFEARAAVIDEDRIMLIVRDITPDRAEEVREVQSQKQLAHTARLSALGEMVAGISHEINQPLHAIGNFASALLNEFESGSDPSREKIVKRLDEIRRQSYRAGEIVKRFKQFSSPASRRSSILASELVSETLELLQSELRHREVRVDVEDHAPKQLFIADRVQLQQVLVNFILNACDAMEKLPPRDRQILIRVAKRDYAIRIETTDNGVGLPDVSMEQLFTSFFTTKEKGLGMGLAISRSILEAHGGRIYATNNPTRGATFVMEIPLPITEPTASQLKTP